MSGTGLAGLLTPGPVSVHLIGADPTDVAGAVTALGREHPGVAVRRIRGSRCRSTAALFDVLAAALQFPRYFGANWNALHDMLLDLRWHPAAAYVLVVEEADEMLADAPDDVLSVGLEVLVGAAEQRAASGTAPFQIVLEAATDGRIARALRQQDTAFDTVDLA